MKQAVVIFSGGQDSTTCLYWAIQKFGRENVKAITFNYGQNHRVEVQQSMIICSMEKIEQVIVNMSFLQNIIHSALLNGGDVNVLNEKNLPASFVPNRNQLFITLAHAYAQKINAEHLVAGMCETDYSGYPDCREKFIEELQRVTNMGSESNISIHTPLMHLTKAATFTLASELGVLNKVVEYSHTCYNGDRQHRNKWGYGCGTCPACVLREKGWNEYVKNI